MNQKVNHTPEAFAHLISGDDAPVVVGGQAVNLWCLLSCKIDPQFAELLRDYAPFVSKDCDVLGDRSLLARLKRKSNLAAYESKFGQPSFCIGYLYDPEDPDKRPFIEVLKGVNGVSTREINEGTPIELNGETYRTMNPLQLLKAKLANACDLPQENRQDVRHVQMLVICVRAYITHTHRLTDPSSVQEVKFLKRMLNHCLALVKSDNARKVQKRYGIGLPACFPVELIKNSPMLSVRKFYEHQLLVMPPE